MTNVANGAFTSIFLQDMKSKSLLSWTCFCSCYFLSELAIRKLKWRILLDHFVGAGEQRCRQSEAERLGGRKIDYKFELGRLFDRDFRRLSSAQDLVDIVCRVPEQIRVAWSVGHERPAFNKITGTEDCRHPLAKRRCEYGYAVSNDELINRHVKCIRSGLQILKCRADVLGPPDGEWSNFE